EACTLRVRVGTSRQSPLYRLERFDVVAYQAVEELDRVFTADLQFPRGGEINHGDAAAYRVVLAAKIAIIFRQSFAHFFHLLAIGPEGPIRPMGHIRRNLWTILHEPRP